MKVMLNLNNDNQSLLSQMRSWTNGETLPPGEVSALLESKVSELTKANQQLEVCRLFACPNLSQLLSSLYFTEPPPD